MTSGVSWGLKHVLLLSGMKVRSVHLSLVSVWTLLLSRLLPNNFHKHGS